MADGHIWLASPILGVNSDEVLACRQTRSHWLLTGKPNLAIRTFHCGANWGLSEGGQALIALSTALRRQYFRLLILIRTCIKVYRAIQWSQPFKILAFIGRMQFLRSNTTLLPPSNDKGLSQPVSTLCCYRLLRCTAIPFKNTGCFTFARIFVL